MTPQRLLVVNTGSSSLKLSVLDGDRTVLAHTVERWSGEQDGELGRVVDEAGPVDAVAHRVVHGGRETTARLVDDEELRRLEGLTSLAPLHQPRALAALRAVTSLLPAVPAVACFDTAFHAGLPSASATYALPRDWNARWGLRRYGFHGLSHGWAAGRAAALLGPGLRVVSCHLGAGASLCAVRDGRSVDTTMGFTPLAGLVMATRSGSVDPGLLLWLQQEGGVPAAELADALEHRSGLAGLSGTSGDLRDVLAAADAGDGDAALAYGVFVHRLAREAAAMTVAAGGLDALVLTGGIGEGSVRVRVDLAERLAHLGVAVDPDATGEDVSAPGAAVRTLVVASREDLQMAREVRALLSAAAGPGPAPTPAVDPGSGAPTR